MLDIVRGHSTALKVIEGLIASSKMIQGQSAQLSGG